MIFGWHLWFTAIAGANHQWTPILHLKCFSRFQFFRSIFPIIWTWNCISWQEDYLQFLPCFIQLMSIISKFNVLYWIYLNSWENISTHLDINEQIRSVIMITWTYSKCCDKSSTWMYLGILVIITLRLF